MKVIMKLIIRLLANKNASNKNLCIIISDKQIQDRIKSSKHRKRNNNFLCNPIFLIHIDMMLSMPFKNSKDLFSSRIFRQSILTMQDKSMHNILCQAPEEDH